MVLVVFVVHVAVLVLQRFVQMKVIMTRANQKHDADGHERRGCAVDASRRVAEQRDREQRAGEWRRRKERGLTGGAELA